MAWTKEGMVNLLPVASSAGFRGAYDEALGWLLYT